MALCDSFVKQEFSPAVDLEEQRKAALLEEMGLTTRDVDKLRTTMLSADEAVSAKQEELERIRQHKGRKNDWEEFADAKRRMGRVLHHTDVARGLRKLIPSLIVFRGGVENQVGLYTVRNMPVDELPDCKLWKKSRIDCPIYLGWMDLGYVPEYEIEFVNDAKVAIGQRRGWRTILLRLIARRDEKGRPNSVITEEQAEKVFGPPTNGPTASYYRRRLWDFRNGRV